jgi:hypothetical protein
MNLFEIGRPLHHIGGDIPNPHADAAAIETREQVGAL